MFGCPEIKSALTEEMHVVSERQDEDWSMGMAAWRVGKTRDSECGSAELSDLSAISEYRLTIISIIQGLFTDASVWPLRRSL